MLTITTTACSVSRKPGAVRGELNNRCFLELDPVPAALDGITTIENIQLSIAKSAYNQAEFVTLFVRGSDGQWSVGVARFKRVR